MKTNTLSALLILVCCTGFAQRVTVIDKGQSTLPKLKGKEVIYTLNEKTDTTSLSFVATLEVKSEPKSFIEDIYEKVVESARELGANGLQLSYVNEEFSHGIFQAYSITPEQVEQIRADAPKNVIYVFAGEKYDSPAYYSFEFNGAGKSIKSGKYFQYTLKEGEQAKLRKGTITGTIRWVRWKPSQLPVYLSINGFDKEPVVKRTTQSPSVKPGKFKEVDPNLGALLVQVLAPLEDK